MLLDDDFDGTMGSGVFGPTPPRDTDGSDTSSESGMYRTRHGLWVALPDRPGIVRKVARVVDDHGLEVKAMAALVERVQIANSPRTMDVAFLYCDVEGPAILVSAASKSEVFCEEPPSNYKQLLELSKSSQALRIHMRESYAYLSLSVPDQPGAWPMSFLVNGNAPIQAALGLISGLGLSVRAASMRFSREPSCGGIRWCDATLAVDVSDARAFGTLGSAVGCMCRALNMDFGADGLLKSPSRKRREVSCTIDYWKNVDKDVY